MRDLISRQAAIDAIERHIRVGDELYPLTDVEKIQNWSFEVAASCVYNLPSAEKRGKWLDGYCSRCGERTVWDETDYCPNCGARMEE